MSCFFTKIKSLLKYDYGGRYLALILKEVIEEDNAIKNQLWKDGYKIKKNSFYLQVEWSFPDRRRIADLALLSKLDGKPIALVEIKYEDEKKEENNAQLDDYVDFCINNNILFTYLTKNRPPINNLKRVGDNYLSYAKLVHKIERKNNISYTAKLLCEFIREEGYVFQKDIDKDALLLLMVNSLSFPDRHGFGQLNTLKRITKDVPKTLEIILNNTSILGSMVYENIAIDLFYKRPRVEYKFIPCFNINKSNKRLLELKNDGEHRAILERNEVEYGDFNSYSYLKFKGGDHYLYLTFGYNYQLEKGKSKKEALECMLFAEIYGKHVEYNFYDKKIKMGLNEEETYIIILKLINKLLFNTMKNKENYILKEQKKVMKSLCKRCMKTF